MIEVAGLRLSLDAALEGNEAQARSEIARQLGVAAEDIQALVLRKRSVDARKKSHVHFINTYQITLSADQEADLLDRAPKGLQVHAPRAIRPLELFELSRPVVPPVVVGAGPAGLFAALYLARCGLCPELIERGAPVEERQRDVENFFAVGSLNRESNIAFGEGGAGTFSDGKLTTNTKNPLTAHVLAWFVEAGAPEEILTEAHPHLGSDNLPHIVAAMRKEIIERGGSVYFHTKMTDLHFDQGRISVLETEDAITGERQWRQTQHVVLACGHSARDVFELCRDKGLAMEQKPFSVGLRIEHTQEQINQAQWGSAAKHPALGAAEYKLAVHLPNGRSVYTFCMCPGGEVVAAASEEGGVVTNGMSNFARDGKNANAAVLVNVDPCDFGSDDVLAGVALQRSIERRAFALALSRGASSYQAPCQRVGAFLRDMGVVSNGDAAAGIPAAVDTTADNQDVPQPTYKRGVVEAPLKQCFPDFVNESLAQALPLLGRKLKGFDNPSALMTAPETRSSSPVRICRSDQLQAWFDSEGEQSGLYPCGEGPGFAGGIMSAAVDGLRVAQQVAKQYAQNVTSA